MIAEIGLIWNLFLAAVFGAVIGLEREIQRHPAGLRTHILVSTGSCLVMLLSTYAFRDFNNWDPGRLAAQVVSGIGFLGAGTILREGASIKGLTTAASLWVVASIGLAVGSGFFLLAFFVTVLSWVTLTFLDVLEKKVISPNQMEIEIIIPDKPGALGKICTQVGAFGFNIKNIEFRESDSADQADILLTIEVKGRITTAIVSKLSMIPGIKHIQYK
ncbi:MAG: MgtC/SapB family protein [Bacillota bacterium]